MIQYLKVVLAFVTPVFLSGYLLFVIIAPFADTLFFLSAIPVIFIIPSFGKVLDWCDETCNNWYKKSGINS